MPGRRYVFTVEAATLTAQQVLSGVFQDRSKTIRALVNLFTGIGSGSWRAGRVEIQPDAGFTTGAASTQTVVYSGSAGSQTINVAGVGLAAAGLLTLSSGSGAVGGTIGGTLVTATWATSDLVSAGLIAAAINANTTVNKFVAASSSVATGTVTISSGSGAITATIGGIAVSVTWATSDTSTATALTTAINANSQVPVIATSSAGVVTVYSRVSGATVGNAVTLTASGTGATASGATLTGGGTNANVLITALNPGGVGLGITLVASGTGVTATTGASFIGGNQTPGTTVTFTAGTTDTLTVAAAIAAIRASPTFLGHVFIPTVPTYGATINTGATLTLWANTIPTANSIGGAMFLTITGTGASLGNATGSFTRGVSGAANGFTV